MVAVFALMFGDLRTVRGAAPSPVSEVNQHVVLPILMQHCWACHGAAVQEAALDLRSKASMLRGGTNGTALVAGGAAGRR